MEHTTLIYYILILLVCTFSAKYPIITTSKTSDFRGVGYFRYFLYYAIPITIYTIFWGIRYEVGGDYLSYKGIFEGKIEYPVEYFYQFLNTLLADCGFNFVSIFLLTSFVNILSIFYLSKDFNKEYVSYAVYFYFTSTLVFFAQNGMRQMLAISIIFLIVSCMSNNKSTISKLLLLCFLGILSLGAHKSSMIPLIILVLLYLLPKLKFNSIILILLLFYVNFIDVSWFSYLLSDGLGVLHFAGYELDFIARLDDFEADNQLGTGLGKILKFVLNSVVIVLYNNHTKSNSQKGVEYYSFVLFVIGILMANTVSINHLMNRLNLYFICFSIFVYSYICTKVLMNEKKIFRIMIILFVTLSTFLLYVEAINTNSNVVVPYKTIFSGDSSCVI